MSSINLFPEFDDQQVQDRNYKNGHVEQKEDELIVFGYSCKLFRDDFSAKAIDRGQSLIPWNGDETVMIDRYDCRGHLFDLTPWDSDLLRKSSSTDPTFLSEAEKCIEEECEQERYLDLVKDMEKEALEKEEEAKRLCADKTGYNQVGFTYEDGSKPKEQSEAIQSLEDDEYEPFYPSEKLQIPYGMEIPESKKLNAVIEKTANFVSSAGLKMEVVLKMKQANNPQFDFLKYDHYLNPYYRHLISMIKSGKYRPTFDNQTNEKKHESETNKNGADQNSSHDDDDEGGDSYLHPLLRGGGGSSSENNLSTKKTDEPVRIPSISMNIHDTAYGQLIKKYEHLRQREKVPKEGEEEKMSNTSEETKNEESSPRSDSSKTNTVIPPPPDVKPIIDKLAEYVARNGSTFEESIRMKDDPRFAFLEREHIHYNYYQLKLQLCSQEIQKKAAEENPSVSDNIETSSNSGNGPKPGLTTNSDESLTPISSRTFHSDEDSNSMIQNETESNGEFIGPRPPSPEFLEKLRKQEQRKDRINEFVREKLVREKQEERKRKAEMLVQKLKNQSTETNESSNINSVLTENVTNVKNDQLTSEKISSPKSNHRVKDSRSTSKSRSHSKYRRHSRSRSRSRNDRRRHRRSSRKRSRSKSRSRHRSKRSKNSKSSRRSRDQRHRRHHRRHRRDSSSESSTSSRSTKSSSSSSSSTSSSTERKKKKVTNEPQAQTKSNPQ